jgi:alpha-ketoglutarate-dependent taurine dioxygenase
LCPQHEQSYRLSFPGLLLLACLQPADTGGQTLLADGRRVLTKLPPSLVARLTAHGWIMVRNFRDRFGVPWQHAFEVADRDALPAKLAEELISHRWIGDGVLRTNRRRSAVVRHPVNGQLCWFNHAAFFNEHGLGLDPEERQVLHEAFGPDGLTLNTLVGDGSPLTPEEVATIEAVYDELTVPVDLAAGDVLLLDNIAVAHGRRPFTGERLIAVAMGEPVTLAS